MIKSLVLKTTGVKGECLPRINQYSALMLNKQNHNSTIKTTMHLKLEHFDFRLSFK